ncbi:restriction endonuclease subunit S [Nostoc linckia FACHB-104]|nr:restriction endonuclease subunit S [Nostoc linckia FACHB-104]
MEDIDNLPELPNAWCWVNFSSLINKLKRGPSKKCNTEGRGIRYITSGNLQDGKLCLNLDYKFLDNFTAIEQCRLLPGDLILNCVNSLEQIGKSSVFYKIHGEAIVGFNNYAIELKQEIILSEYVNIVCQSRIFKTQIYFLIKRAINQVSFATKELNLISIPLPPLNEQRRIVAKIEALSARSQRVKEALEDIPQLLDQFRQSVLAAAFRGDLTADWREQNSNVEPASVLLERIHAERLRKWCKEISNKGKNPSKNKYDEPIKPDINQLPELPANWTWATLDQLLFSLRNGLSKPPVDEPPGIPILRISAVRAMQVNTNDVRFYRVDNPNEINNYLLEAHDLLFTRYNGSRSFVGVCGLVPKTIDNLLYPDKLIRGQLVDKSLSLPEYLELACNFGVSRLHIERHIKTSAGQQGIAGTDIKATPIPLPPLSEQYAIVHAIKQQFSAIQNLTSFTNNCFQDLQIFNQSILAKAFRGELVPQDPNDEPASVLLERIRSERAKLQTKTAKKSTTKTSAGRTKKTQPQEEESVQLELGLE